MSSLNITSYQVIDQFHSDLTNIAANCGIDFDKLLERLRFDGVAIKRGIELSKAYRGKVWAIASEWTDHNGNRYPTITFKTFKDGGYSETWNGFKAWRERADYAAIPQAYQPKKPNPVTADKAEQEFQRKINRFSAFRKLFEQLPKLSADNFEGCNLAAKGFVFDDLPDNLDLRRGADSRGKFIAYPLRNGQSQTVGYQTIHDAEFVNYEGNARAKDFYFYPDSYNGSHTFLGEPPKDKNSLVRHGEGLASCLTAHIASGLPVVICLNTTNTPHVVKELTKQGYTNLQAIADNDITDNDNGNAGVFWAIKAARYVSDKIIVPELNGKKCDIDDVRQALGMNAVHDQLETNTLDIPKNPLEYHKLLAKYAPKKQLGGVIASCCYFAAQRITMPKQLRIQTKTIAALGNKSLKPEPIISKELHQQANAIAGLRYGSPTAICKLIKRHFKKRLDALKYDNTITDFEDITRHDCNAFSKDNEKIRDLILEIGKGIILDNRSMGAGKTNLMCLIARHFSGKTRTAYIAHRVALTKSASERLDLHHYQSGKSHFESIAICVDSIISHNLFGVSVLFLDEIRQVLEHILHAKTVKNRDAVYNQLIQLIQNADLVICADADMNQATVDWLKFIANKPLHSIDTTPDKTDKTIHALANDSESIYSALQAIEDGQNVWIATDSTKQAYKLKIALLNAGLDEDNLLFLTQKNKGDERQAAFLLNPDKESQKYRVVIHTPVISSGVSIENNHFHKVFALFRNVIAPNEMLQTIGRVRAVKNIYVSFKANHSKNRPTHEQDLIDGEMIKRARYDNGMAIFTDFDTRRIQLIAAKNKALNSYRETFLLLAQMKGYSVEMARGEYSAIKGLSKAATVLQSNQITTADDIDSDQAKAISKNPNPTQAQSNALDKYKVSEMTGKSGYTITQDDAKFYLQGGMKIVANHELINADINELKQRDRDNLIIRDRWSSLTSKHCFLKVVVEGLLGKRITQTTARQFCEFMQQFHKELAANEMGNFKTISKYPIRQLSDFVKQCGYELKAQKDSKGNRDYILQVNPQVLEYVKNRTAHAKSVVNKNVSCAVA